ncbi:MAG: hypothetical protein KBD15_02460 [Candidatus Magasanikbacteria bacterium]|jgi:hypothetical protein|nr:hypothetical protein [Candidatus Magasanikbacteria bacterium]
MAVKKPVTEFVIPKTTVAGLIAKRLLAGGEIHITPKYTRENGDGEIIELREYNTILVSITNIVLRVNRDRSIILTVSFPDTEQVRDNGIRPGVHTLRFEINYEGEEIEKAYCEGRDVPRGIFVEA